MSRSTSTVCSTSSYIQWPEKAIIIRVLDYKYNVPKITT